MRMIVAGNWKMNKELEDAGAMVDELVRLAPMLPEGVEVVVAPPFPFLAMAVERTLGTRIRIAAQNCHQAPSGAYTGEVSVGMLRSIGVSACIVGHSERRHYFGEQDATVKAKVGSLLAADLTPIYCCGERKEDRTSETHFKVVRAQLEEALGSFSATDLARVVIAYEPVWAIGTGLTATPGQAQEMHAYIRGWLEGRVGKDAASVPVLYGGSCTPSNAHGLFALADVNGGLIGGASLTIDPFVELIRIAGNSKR